MQVAVAGRQMEVTEALRQYATDKFQKLDRYLGASAEAAITLSVVKKIHHLAEASIKSNGTLIQASQETEEMYSAIDLLYDKLERRLRRYKERLLDQKHRAGKSGPAAGPAAPAPAEDAGPRIIRTKSFDMKPMLPDEAVMQLELLDKDFFVFPNAETGRISVIYRRKDGNVGLIEPSR